MRYSKIIYFLLILFSLLTGCSTAKHGSFTTNTYIEDQDNKEVAEEIGPVKGSSCQTMILYIFPMGSAPSTNEAVESAKSQYGGTKYITDVSIDDRIEWKIGYSVQCITVEGTAHKIIVEKKQLAGAPYETELDQRGEEALAFIRLTEKDLGVVTRYRRQIVAGVNHYFEFAKAGRLPMEVIVYENLDGEYKITSKGVLE